MSTWNGFKLIKGAVSKTALDLNILMRDGVDDPILPATRDKIVEIPNRNGVHYFGADIDARRITIPCNFLYASTIQQLKQHARTLAAFLLDSNNKPAKLELIFEAEPDKAYWVYYSGQASLTRSIFDGEFDLPLIAPDPFPHDVTP